MSDRSSREEILEAMEGLGESERRRVLEYMHSLSDGPPRGVPGESLLPFLGSIPRVDVDEMAAAIEEGCEKVNLDAW